MGADDTSEKKKKQIKTKIYCTSTWSVEKQVS